MVAVGYVGASLVGTYQGISGNVMELLSTTLSTGVTSGGLISVNPNPALIDIAPATGWIVDYNSSGTLSPTNPMLTPVTFAGQTGIALVGPPTQTLTYWSINASGNVVQSAVAPTLAQIRSSLFLGASAQFAGVNIAVRNLPLIQSQPGAQIFDLISSLGAFNLDSHANIISANGANRRINTSGGNLFIRAYGLNFGTYQNPHVAKLVAQAPASFRYATGTTILAPFVNNIDVSNYDPGGLGVVTPIGGGANTTTVHRVFISGSPVPSEQIIVQYGQTTFASLAAAVAAIGTGTYITNPTFTGTITGYIAATRTAVNLSDVTQASFTHAPRFANP